jgi:large subunit ribosomal protein L25
MADEETLTVQPRERFGSRETRRLRRSGRVPGIVYGGAAEPRSIEVDARTLRNALARAGAVLRLSVGEGDPTPVMLKDEQRHPVRGETLHVDFLRVRMDETIQSTLALELEGADVAPGVKEGGVLEQVTHEVAIEALPGDIPEVVTHDVSEMGLGDTLTLQAVAAPRGVTFLDDLEETVIATITTASPVEEPGDELEQETELVGEDAAQAQGATGDEAASAQAGGDAEAPAG